MQQNEPGLFDLGQEPTQTPSFEEPLITDQQVQAIREAFQFAGITSTEERQELIESCTARPVSNIRELQGRDFRRVLKRISERQQEPKAGGTGSAWDNRDEDTWIDKL